MKFNTKRVKAERIARGIPQTKMAELLGISRDSYMRKENGKRPISVDELVTMCHIFNIPQDHITLFFENNVDNRLHNKEEVC